MAYGIWTVGPDAGPGFVLSKRFMPEMLFSKTDDKSLVPCIFL